MIVILIVIITTLSLPDIKMEVRHFRQPIQGAALCRTSWFQLPDAYVTACLLPLLPLCEYRKYSPTYFISLPVWNFRLEFIDYPRYSWIILWIPLKISMSVLPSYIFPLLKTVVADATLRAKVLNIYSFSTFYIILGFYADKIDTFMCICTSKNKYWKPIYFLKLYLQFVKTKL